MPPDEAKKYTLFDNQDEFQSVIDSMIESNDQEAILKALHFMTVNAELLARALVNNR
jgi:hypothetical protein